MRLALTHTTALEHLSPLLLARQLLRAQTTNASLGIAHFLSSFSAGADPRPVLLRLGAATRNARVRVLLPTPHDERASAPRRRARAQTEHEAPWISHAVLVDVS